MKGFGRISVFLWGAMVVLATVATAREVDALKALEDIKVHVETAGSYEQYTKLLVDAKTEIDILKRDEEQNQCFMKAVERCYQYYVSAENEWRCVIKTKAEKLKFEHEGHDSGVKMAERMIRTYEGTKLIFWQKAAEQLDKAYTCLE